MYALRPAESECTSATSASSLVRFISQYLSTSCSGLESDQLYRIGHTCLDVGCRSVRFVSQHLPTSCR